MRFAKDNALMLETKKPTNVKLPGGGWYEIDDLGDKRWYNDRGEIHRLDGPAVEWADGGRGWCVNGNIHRLDGPAVEWADGSKFWFVNDKEYSKKEFDKLFGKYTSLEDKQVVADMEGLF